MTKYQNIFPVENVKSPGKHVQSPVPLKINEKSGVKKVRRRLKPSDDLREFIVDDYLLLYLVLGERIVFLAIKHHRQLAFDLKEFWQD